MASRVFVHIGLPKTATTYLQTIVWGARDRLRHDGVLLPGVERRDHLWSSRVIREDPKLPTAPRKHRTAWSRLCAEIAEWPGTALVSHEFFAAASTAQAERMVADLAPAEVHVVLTAREPLGLFTASWQESLKNRDCRPMARYSTVESANPQAVWNWRTLDLTLVLDRWGDVVPADRVHVLPLNPRAARDDIWRRFAGLIGADPDGYDTSGSFPNTSMGVVEAETLRRINERLEARDLFVRSFERGVYIRTYLADQLLVPRGGDRFWPTPAQVEDCRERGDRAARSVVERGFDVIGGVADLRVPETLGERRQTDSVTDAEVAAVATDLVAQVTSDVRELRRELRRAREELARVRALPPPPPPVPLWRRLASRVRRLLSPRSR